MGANTFYDIAWRDVYPDADIAFYALCEEDCYENGHSYSGGIGMKNAFVHIASVATIEEAEALAEKLISDGDPRIDDKWGPAGCITTPDRFLFFGWASS
jgi:hypothetical protein